MMPVPDPFPFERLDTEAMSDKAVLMGSLGRLAMVSNPTSQWAPVFSNPDLMHLPGLRCKGFTVWFPILHDFVGAGVPELRQLISAGRSRSLPTDRLHDLTNRLSGAARQLLALFSRTEQFFLYDRRLQNVHGLVSQFFRDTFTTRWYDSASDAVVRERLPAADYHPAMRDYYQDMQATELALLTRCVTSAEWIDLGRLIDGDASMESLAELAGELGVGD